MRTLRRILSVFLALAVVVTAVPAVAGLSASLADPEAVPMMDAAQLARSDIDDCCTDCVPAAGGKTSCIAICVQLPALPAAGGVSIPRGAPVFDPAIAFIAAGRQIPPDPFPPRARA
jgi:hypothetical protein